MNKMINKIFGVLLIAAIVAMPLQMHAEDSQAKTSNSWYESFRITDYLPAFIGKKIIAWRTNRMVSDSDTQSRINGMFSGTQSSIDKMSSINKAQTAFWADKSGTAQYPEEQYTVSTKYNKWIEQYRDIINKKSAGHTILGLWLDSASVPLEFLQFQSIRDIVKHLFFLGAKLDEKEIMKYQKAKSSYELFGIPSVLEHPEYFRIENAV